MLDKLEKYIFGGMLGAVIVVMMYEGADFFGLACVIFGLAAISLDCVGE